MKSNMKMKTMFILNLIPQDTKSCKPSSFNRLSVHRCSGLRQMKQFVLHFPRLRKIICNKYSYLLKVIIMKNEVRV